MRFHFEDRLAQSRSLRNFFPSLLANGPGFWRVREGRWLQRKLDMSETRSADRRSQGGSDPRRWAPANADMPSSQLGEPRARLLKELHLRRHGELAHVLIQS